MTALVALALFGQVAAAQVAEVQATPVFYHAQDVSGVSVFAGGEVKHLCTMQASGWYHWCVGDASGYAVTTPSAIRFTFSGSQVRLYIGGVLRHTGTRDPAEWLDTARVFGWRDGPLNAVGGYVRDLGIATASGTMQPLVVRQGNPVAVGGVIGGGVLWAADSVWTP